MQAVILAGGKGTRLTSLTNDLIPKHLVKIHGRPLLDHAIHHVASNNFDRIIICTGHLGHKIKEHIDQNLYPIPIELSHEKHPLGTAGALRLIKDKLEEEFLILYADVYTSINLKKMYEYHKFKKSDVTIAIHTSDHPHDSTITKIDEQGKLIEMVEKPGRRWDKLGNLTQTSIYFVKKSILFQFIPKNNICDLARDVFPLMLKANKKMFGYLTDEFTKDIGTPERFKQVASREKQSVLT